MTRNLVTRSQRGAIPKLYIASPIEALTAVNRSRRINCPLFSVQPAFVAGQHVVCKDSQGWHTSAGKSMCRRDRLSSRHLFTSPNWRNQQHGQQTSTAQQPASSTVSQELAHGNLHPTRNPEPAISTCAETWPGTKTQLSDVRRSGSRGHHPGYHLDRTSLECLKSFRSQGRHVAWNVVQTVTGKTHGWCLILCLSPSIDVLGTRLHWLTPATGS